MAAIRILSWNVQVYGPKKYGDSINGPALLFFVGAVAQQTGANIVVFTETISSVSEQVAFSLREAIQKMAGGTWSYHALEARPNGNREAYVFCWRSDPAVGFVRAVDASNNPVLGLAAIEFPNNISDVKGRLAAFTTFTTTDTNKNFTVTAYHAPPNYQASLAPRQLASMTQIYEVANPALGPAGATVPARLLCGDYNLDVKDFGYRWLTNKLTKKVPPDEGYGAGCAAASTESSLLYDYDRAVSNWSPRIDRWPTDSMSYRRPGFAIDNIFYASPGAAGERGVFDVIAQLTTRQTAIRYVAELGFSREDPPGIFASGPEAFPHAKEIPLPWTRALDSACYAYLFYRYAISDHLPVLLAIAI